LRSVDHAVSGDTLVAPLLAWTGLAAAFVLALAAVLRMTAPGSGGPPVSGVIRLPEAVTAVVVSLFGLAVCVFVVDLIRRALSNAKRQEDGEAADEPAPVPAWLRRLGLIMSLVNVIALAYLWRRALLEGGLFAGFGGLTSGLGLPSSIRRARPRSSTGSSGPWRSRAAWAPSASPCGSPSATA
jgi:hypothetical protein